MNEQCLKSFTSCLSLEECGTVIVFPDPNRTVYKPILPLPTEGGIVTRERIISNDGTCSRYDAKIINRGELIEHPVYKAYSEGYNGKTRSESGDKLCIESFELGQLNRDLLPGEAEVFTYPGKWFLEKFYELLA